MRCIEEGANDERMRRKRALLHVSRVRLQTPSRDARWQVNSASTRRNAPSLDEAGPCSRLAVIKHKHNKSQGRTAISGLPLGGASMRIRKILYVGPHNFISGARPCQM